MFFVARCTVLQGVNISILFLLVFRLFLCVAFMNNAGVNALCVFHVHFQSFITGSAPRSGTRASKDTCVFHSLETAEQFSRGAVHLPFPPAVRILVILHPHQNLILLFYCYYLS